MNLHDAVLKVRNLVFGEHALAPEANPEQELQKISSETGVDEQELLLYFNNFAMLKIEVDKLEDDVFEKKGIERTGTLEDLSHKNWKKPALAILNMYWESRERDGVKGDDIEIELQEILQRGGIKYKYYQLNPKNIDSNKKRRGRPRKHAPKTADAKKVVTLNTNKFQNEGGEITEKSVSPTMSEVVETSFPTHQEPLTTETKLKDTPITATSLENKKYSPIDVHEYSEFQPPQELDIFTKLGGIASHLIDVQKVTEDNEHANRVFDELFDGLYVMTYFAAKNATKNREINQIEREKEQLRRRLELEKAKADHLEKEYKNLARSILELDGKDGPYILEQLGRKFETWKKQISESGYAPNANKGKKIQVDSNGFLVSIK